MAVSQKAQLIAAELKSAIDAVLAKHGMKNIRGGKYSEYRDTGRIVMTLDIHPTVAAPATPGVAPTTPSVTAEEQRNLESVGLAINRLYTIQNQTFRITGTKNARPTHRNPHHFWVLGTDIKTNRSYKIPADALRFKTPA